MALVGTNSNVGTIEDTQQNHNQNQNRSSRRKSLKRPQLVNAYQTDEVTFDGQSEMMHPYENRSNGIFGGKQPQSGLSHINIMESNRQHIKDNKEDSLDFYSNDVTMNKDRLPDDDMMTTLEP